jgi:hypothetical protein
MTRYLLGYCQEHRKVSSDIHRASRIGTLEEWERRVGTRAVGGGNGMGQPWPRAGCGWCPGWKRRAGARALARWLGRRERTLLSTALHGFLADARYGSWSQQRPRADAGRCFGIDGIDLKALSCRVIYDNVYSSHKGRGGFARKAQPLSGADKVQPHAAGNALPVPDGDPVALVH